MPAKKLIKESDKKDSVDYASKLDKIIGELGLESGPSVEKSSGSQSQASQTTQPSKDLGQAEIDKTLSTVDKYVDDRKITPEAYEKSEPDGEMNPIRSPVYLYWKALKRIVGYGKRYANEKIDMKKWREVYGILIGSIEEDTLLVVKDAIPVCVGGKTGVELEPIHYVDLAQIDASIFERYIEDKRNDFIVGWWHTHPGFGFFYSEVDTYTHLGYQIPNPYAVGLIFDHCEKKPDYLGVAGLRLTDPEEGLLSDYRICELHYDDEKEILSAKLDKVVDKVQSKISDVLVDLDYIDNTLRKKALAQLQRNFGLILVPKRELKDTDDEDEAELSDEKLYVWDPDYYKKKYRIPKFREKVEEEIRKAYISLQKLLEKDLIMKYEQQKEKYKKKLVALLDKPNKWLDKILDEFNERIAKIYKIYDYLDTEERRIIEYFEERLAEYTKILEELNGRAQFKTEQIALKA